MNKRFLILSLLVILTFSGCFSAKQTSITTNADIETLAIDSEDEDSFLDEFEDEMEIEDIFDPFSPINRVTTTINDNLYFYVLKPIATGYKFVTPSFLRYKVNNFFDNLAYPVRVVNNLLQFKFLNATEETGRFLINSTLGVFGFFDSADYYFGLKEHKEDFGQTLGYYGVPSGPHIVLPIFGPSNLRDIVGTVPDSFLQSTNYIEGRFYNLPYNLGSATAIKTYKVINGTAINGEEYENLKQSAIDLYPFLRDIYEQHRDTLIDED